MKLLRQLIAALLLLVWFTASAHVALAHGGGWVGRLAAEESGTPGHHGGRPAEEDHHHHDLGDITTRQSAKTSAHLLTAPRLEPVFARLLAGLVASRQAGEAQQRLSLGGVWSSDERASGWLLVVQTALPVRGPSLAV